ncbi:MAG: surface lipoprotein assembly modifier [Polaromonas sp.]|uniref:surface lipoprotein assembly modifier n=1 Tax=Polaromonas sp. TaxID=1869339 RepID=UPI002488AA0E|nr:surface lipoprotein assembly modifier [Polaromonas sp.]MDI1238303.1 surface lipoprotein assembly modifier [Polaromonas sp.]
MSFKRFFFQMSAAWLAAVFSCAAYAEADALVRESLALVEQGKAQQAFDQLATAEASRAGDPDFDTVLGIAANDTGQFTRAVFALERVLTVQPGNSRARAELGRALFSLGDNQAARQVLQETKRDDIPPEAARKIDEFLQAIDRNEEAARSSIRGYLEGSIGSDSNINSGPGNANVAVPSLGGLVLTLSPTSVKLKDSFYSVSAGVSGRFVIDPRLSLIASASGNYRFNNDYNDFDTNQFDISAGASYKVGKDEYTAAAQVGTFSADNRGVRDQRGVVGEWTHRPDAASQWTSYLQMSTLRYPGQSLRDAERYVLGTSYARAFRAGLLAFGGVYAGTENERAANVPHLGHRLAGLRAGLQQTVNADVDVFGNAGYEERRYGGADPLFLVTRRDKQTSLNLGLTWVPFVNWRVTPQWSLLRTDSNIAISDFSKRVFSVTVRRDF